MRITDQYIWNFVFSLFFLSLVVAGTIILNSIDSRSLDSITPLEIVILSLATLRLTRLFVYDKITAFFREQFYDVVETRGKQYLEKPASGPRRTLADLTSCIWCFGMWAGATVTFFFFLTPYAYFPILFFAISGLGSMLQLLASWVGWNAERVKKEAGE